MTLRSFWLLGLLIALSACGGGDRDEGRDDPPVVVGGTVTQAEFVSEIEAVGTAFANEQTVITSPVTERIERIAYADGATVRRGAVIARLSSGEESADLSSVVARAREAGKQLDRLTELQERGFATNSSVDQQTALRDAARADANAIRSRISDRVIRAPFDGVLSLRTVSPGTVVTSGSPIATISDISAIKLDFTVPENFLSALKPGQVIEAKTAAYPDQSFFGTIDNISPLVDPLSRSLTVRAKLPNDGRKLRPGMLMSVRIVSETRTGLAVPETALVAQGDQNFVFVVDKEGIARRTAIDIGLRSKGMVEVKSGIALGAKIVADGTVKVRDDSPVKAVLPGQKNTKKSADNNLKVSDKKGSAES
ncbi:MAG: efflux RND transporter periplasmic adaptor subunit [Sphingomonadales bacterium]|nr:efflux RND transporter periplasmic adaptor subunit [Sphingomonadales bacterium]PIX67550.1 MAG: efflux transporter periplasmic adaptor subunit [Sphingomonadales bacterium CG_4_10_14_3_um_filter_58_15]NCO49374.1 efflux RND transporter periplasmic adaptor subunit [Sphingomonadales bacterium]NCP00095.1 efflux RND transporter periplasmic adaptor subunit [Sphingomonadales bacterium]NCP27240.1 efflux RND transporter periplasmic adaptor subunit [Sphingomonadales bacterium]